MLLLQIAEAIQDKALEVSPYNAAAYGFLVLVLILVNYSSVKMYQSEKKYNRERDEKILELLPLIVDRLNRQTDMPQDLEKINTDTKTILSEARAHTQRLEDKLNELVGLFNKHFKV